jgi:hypothetical protein
MIARLLAAAGVILVAAAAQAEDDRGEAHGGLRVYVQPAPSDFLLVVTPSASARVQALRWLRVDVDWSADVVTGATPRSYGSPDVITAATQFSETRNAVGAGVAASVGPATLSAGYGYGTENDYRSQLVRAGVRLDLAKHDTIIDAAYSHSFDGICDLAQPNVPLLQRQPLDTSRGCFAGLAQLTTERLDGDDVELSLTQAVTPKLVAVAVGTYEHRDGFQSNPYRSVVLDGGLHVAQESHPRVRDRGAATLRLRYAVAPVHATLALDARFYRDTWGITAGTLEADWQQPFTTRSPWRFGARVRGYVQSRAAFYRDAGESDSYERKGPAGQYFTADQELAPLADLIAGVRAMYAASRPDGRRIWHMFTSSETTLRLDYVKGFALTPDPPNVARLDNWATALVLSASVIGRF